MDKGRGMGIEDAGNEDEMIDVGRGTSTDKPPSTGQLDERNMDEPKEAKPVGRRLPYDVNSDIDLDNKLDPMIEMELASAIFFLATADLPLKELALVL